MNKKIEELTDTELKALAFEHSMQVEHSQASIITIKNELLKRQQEAIPPALAEPVSKLSKAK